jgi:glycosyltransferase involved in cell wall biosynthesis
VRKVKLFKLSTVPISLNLLLKGQLNYLSEYYEIHAISGEGKDLDLVSSREGVKTKAISFKRKISLINDIVSLIRLCIYFRKEKPQIIHSITPKAGLVSMLAGKISGVPIRLHTFTGLIFPSKKGLFQKLLILTDKILCWASTGVYAEGNGVKIDLLKYNITSKEIKIIANGNINGIDCEYFNFKLVSENDKSNLRSEYNITNHDFVFLYVGRIVRDKGINELVSAFLKLNNPNIKLILLGSFELNLDPVQPHILESINACNEIICPGFQDDVRKFYAISDVFVLPSYREGFPNSLLQAGSMGLPSIVSNVNGCNEIIKDGINGVVIPAKDKDALCHSMSILYENNNFKQLLGSNAREIICSNYTNKVVWESLVKEYDRLLISQSLI